MKSTIKQLKKAFDECEAIVIGAGSGLSASAGFEYDGKNFMDNFKYMHDRYGYTDMYSAGFHPFKTSEEKWGYWSKYVYLNRYKDGAKPLYKILFNLVKDKDYFVITTNVDHQFQLAGFDKSRLFYMQGDYGLFQCSKACHNKTYSNKEAIFEMIHHTKDGFIPTVLIPKCPVCGKEMRMNLREDDLFVEDEGWYKAKDRYEKFINGHENKKVLYLELGVGYSTPVWIKYPFMRFTYENPDSVYAVIEKGKYSIPDEIEDRSLFFNADIGKIITDLYNLEHQSDQEQ